MFSFRDNKSHGETQLPLKFNHTFLSQQSSENSNIEKITIKNHINSI